MHLDNSSQAMASGSNTGSMGALLSPLLPASLDQRQKDRTARMLLDDLRRSVICGTDQRERCHAVFLGDQRQYLGSSSVGHGRQSTLSLSLRELFQKALTLEARGMVIAHSHPSGDCRPSGPDIEATRRISEVANSLGIELIDHLIFSQQRVYSMRKGGLL